MKKFVLLGSFVLFLISCGISNTFSTNGYKEVNNKVNIYFDNSLNEDVTVMVLLDHFITFGGITLEKNTIGSFIEVDFSNVDEGEGNLGIEIMTSDSAIQYFPVTPFEITNITGERKYSMQYPKNYIVVENSNTSGAIEIYKSDTVEK